MGIFFPSFSQTEFKVMQKRLDPAGFYIRMIFQIPSGIESPSCQPPFPPFSDAFFQPPPKPGLSFARNQVQEIFPQLWIKVGIPAVLLLGNHGKAAKNGDNQPPIKFHIHPDPLGTGGKQEGSPETKAVV